MIQPKIALSLAIAMTMVLMCSVPGCKDPVDPPATPVYDTTIVTVYDTLIRPYDVIDTTRTDTIVRDTLIPVTNDYVVCSYVSYYGKRWPLPQYLTHAIYSCAELYVVDNVYQKIGLHMTSGTDKSRFIHFTELKQKNPDLKLMVSVAHVCDLSDNEQGGSFSAISKDSMMRRQFALDCVAMCEQYNLDGIDINWELPGLSQSGAAADVTCDTENFTLLMRDMRAVFIETGHPDYLLTYAGHSKNKEKVEGGYRFMDNAAASPYINWANVMCYGLDQAPQPQNAILASSAYRDIVYVYKQYYNNGFPMNKFTLGVPFYTHPPKSDTSIKGEWYYYTIKGLIEAYPNTYRWNYSRRNTWGVPYVEKNINGTWTMYGSIEDPESLRLKADFIRSKGMCGIMWWENEGDDSYHTLQKAAWNAFKTEILHDTTFVYQTDTIHALDTTIVAHQDTIITKRQ